MRIYVIALFLSPLVLHAQYILNLDLPKLGPGYYETLQAKTNLPAASRFQMRGSVKSVCETVTLFDSTLNRSVFHRKEYLFSENQNLLHYLEDSASTLHDDTDGITEMEYTYDSAGNLLESVFYSAWPMNPSKTIRKWNSQGFIEQEIYTCKQCASGYYNSERDGAIFDYTLDYKWSPDFDSVALKYQYVKPNSPYQRHSDMVHSFVGEQAAKKEKLSGTNPKFAAGIPPNYFQFYQDEIKRDHRDRIIEWIVWDHAIKSSVNVHRKTEYEYNEKDELTEIRYFSTHRSAANDEFLLDSRVKIRYVSYDVQGNWTEREVISEMENRGYHFPRRVYWLKREFGYY